MKALRLSLSLTSGMAPALALDFLSGSLDARVTFTRGSTGTYFNSSGVLSSAAINTPRFDYDPVTLAAKGLLIEEARTNLAVRSQEFDNAAWVGTNCTISANTTTAPDGTVTADSITATTADPVVTQTLTVAAVANTASIYVKGSANTIGKTVRVWLWFAGTATGPNTPVSITLTAGWQRVTSTATATGAGTALFRIDAQGTSTVGDVFHLWGAQLEAGAFATSYIPTVASTVTRSADVATMTGTNFSSWYNQSAGTFVAAFDRFGFDSSAGSVLLAQADDGTTNNRVALRLNARLSDAAAQATIVNGGSVIVNAHAGALTSMVDRNVRAAMAYQVGVPAVGRDGSVADVAAAASLPTVNQLTIGQGAGAAVINGHIRSFAYFNTRLPNAQLQALTA